jgi:hypothetical protein
MADVYASIGSRSNIAIADGDSKLPSSATGAGNFSSPWTMTYSSSPGDVGVGDKLAITDSANYSGTTFYYFVKSVSGNTVEVVWMYEDSGAHGAQKPTDLEVTDEYGDTELAGHTYSRTYSNVKAWETGLNNSNFYSANDDLTGWMHSDSDFDEENVIFNYTSTTYDSIKLTVNEDDRQHGIEGQTGKVVNKPDADPGGDSSGIYTLSIDNFTVEWIEFDMSSSTSSHIVVQTGSTNSQNKINATIQHLLIHSWGTNQTTAPMHGILCRGGSGGYQHVFNCICYDFQESDDHVTAFNFNPTLATVKCYNNTSYDMTVTTRTDKYASGYFWGTGGTINIKNCIAIDSENTAGGGTASHSIDFRRGSGSDDCDFCLSSDSTADTYGTNAQINKTAANTFENPGSDMRIKSTSDAAGNGTDLGTEANIDISEFDRNGVDVSWDIGAYQVTRSASSATAGATFLLLLN